MFLACVTDGTRPKMFLMVIEAFFFFFFLLKKKHGNRLALWSFFKFSLCVGGGEG